MARYELSAEAQTAPRPAADSLPERAFPYAGRDQYNRPDLWRAAIPAGAGIGTARAVARHDAALIGDGADGVRLLPPARGRRATALQTEARDVVLEMAPRKALGSWLGGAADSPMGARPTAFGHPGYGGSHGFADPGVGLAFGLTRTTAGGVPALDIARRVRDALDLPH